MASLRDRLQLALAFGIILAAASPTGASEPADSARAKDANRLFTLKVLPLLKEKCFGCHGSDPEDIRGAYDLRTRAGLRLVGFAVGGVEKCEPTGDLQPEVLDDPADWMTPELARRYRQVYELQAESGMSLAEMGVRYMASRADIDTIIIGARLPVEIEECVMAVEKGPLPEDMLQVLEKDIE